MGQPSARHKALESAAQLFSNHFAFLFAQTLLITRMLSRTTPCMGPVSAAMGAAASNGRARGSGRGSIHTHVINTRLPAERREPRGTLHSALTSPTRRRRGRRFGGPAAADAVCYTAVRVSGQPARSASRHGRLLLGRCARIDGACYALGGHLSLDNARQTQSALVALRRWTNRSGARGSCRTPPRCRLVADLWVKPSPVRVGAIQGCTDTRDWLRQHGAVVIVA